MERRDKLFAAGLLALLFFAAAAGMFAVHFMGKDSKQEKVQEKKTAKGMDIRVVISTGDFSGIFHDQAVLSPVGPCILSWDQERADLQAGTQWSAAEFFAEHPRVSVCRITPKEQEGIAFCSIARGYGQPVYQGTLEVRRTSQGLVVVNELPLETYLRYVVPSEMPASFGEEPLKAQAVCARNFAYRHMQNPAYIEFGADLDDSIRYQVYNNSQANQAADEAIQATAGQYLLYNGSVIDAYYYSTSWGFTTDLSLWGSQVQPYYVSHWQGDGTRSLDLSREEVFQKTLNEETGAFESKEPWYRWSFTITKDRILENLRELPLVDLDALSDVLIAGRRPGGSVRELILMGGGKTVSLTRESEIRSAFLPKTEQVTRNDGSVMDGYEKLPSSFFYIENHFEKGELASVTVYGGGCGHGIGMSQNCAKALGGQGKNCREILQYFYPGTEIGEMPPL